MILSPKIKFTKDTYLFDARLEAAELVLFEDCIGKQINGLRLEQLSLPYPFENYFSSIGRCCIPFVAPNVPTINICLASQHKEYYGPIVDQGALKIQKVVTEIKNNTRERLLLPPHSIDPSFNVDITYFTNSPVSSIRFYGAEDLFNLRDDTDYTTEDLKKYGFEVFPQIECYSIEFIVLEHEDGKFAIISLDHNGFFYRVDLQGPLTKELMLDSYIKVNGYEKKIVLHHEIN